MKLVISVISSEDAGELSQALCSSGFSSTRLAATGGFLCPGTTTLITVCEDEDVPTVTDVIRDHAGALSTPVSRLEQPYTPVAACGASIFVQFFIFLSLLFYVSVLK